MHVVLGTKTAQTQKFLTDGTRIPVTVVATPGNPVVMVKTKDKDGYWAVQLGLGIRKHAGKSMLSHVKKAQLTKAPFLLKEVRFSEKDAETLPTVGEVIAANTVFEAGDIVDVTGFSKGKGFAGGVKRYHFKGGPKSHGQSDRHRAPGSIGSGTTPGRVYKGKRMAGKMGNEVITVKNLEVVEVGPDFIWIKGVVPGALGEAVTVINSGKKDKKFVGVLKAEETKATEETNEPEVVGEVQAEVVEQAQVEEPKAEAPVETAAPAQEESKEEPVAQEEVKAEEPKEEATK